jgi:integral membrane protein
MTLGEQEDLAQLRLLRMASVVEGVTLVALLLLAVPAKHLLGFPSATRIVGTVHGLVFLAYVWILIGTVSGGGWRRTEIVRLVITAFIPFGAVANASLLSRKETELKNGRSMRTHPDDL